MRDSLRFLVIGLCLGVVAASACARHSNTPILDGTAADYRIRTAGVQHPEALHGAVAGGAELHDEELNVQFPSYYRGWDYLARKLRRDGVPEDLIRDTFQDPRMKEWTPITFALRPREHSNLYRGFERESSVRKALGCLREQGAIFSDAERRFGVSRYLLAALLYVETHCGQNLGEALILERLVRVASVAEPRNVRFNLETYKPEERAETETILKQRASYLEETFYPEVKALFDTARIKNVGVFELRGSSAGAFGIPQFLPSSYLRYGVDGDGDGRVSLFDFPDAVHSAAFYLQSFGWIEPLTVQEKRGVLWHYNRSEAYGEAVLRLSVALRMLEQQKLPSSPLVDGLRLASND